MKLSLKVEYACQVLAQLGYTYKKEKMPHIEDLSKAEDIPSNYLVQILNELRMAGLIVSRRGKQGGYALAKSPREISLLNIVEAVDGNLLSFTQNGSGESAKRTEDVWTQVESVLRKSVSSFTVENLMNANNAEMWYI